MAKADITADRLRENFHYDPETGVFTAKSGKMTGKPVGFLVPPKNYMRIFIEGTQQYAHRLAWLYMTGEWPSNQIDHINGSKADNRWLNLREVTGEVNQQNRHRAMPWNKTSGLLGVCWHKGNEMWVAQISLGGRTRVLGFRHDPQEAYELYVEAKRKLHEGCTL